MTSRRCWRALVAVCSLAGGVRGTTVLRSPYIQNVQSGRATILWTTQESGAGLVTISHAGNPVASVAASIQAFEPAETQLSGAFYQFRADVTGLQPNTLYSYHVTVDGQDIAVDSDLYRFRTAPATGGFSFLALGDSGMNSPEQARLASQMAAESDVSLVLHLGDLAYPAATYEQLDSEYFAPYRELMRRLPFFPVAGNHEYAANAGAPYLAVHATPASNVPGHDAGRYYSFDWGDVHFVALDTNLLGTASSAQMLDWLDRDLQGTGKFWKIVYCHHLPYPTGHHVGDPTSAQVLALVVPIAERNGVQLFLAGHEHAYERSFPLRSSQPVTSQPATVYVVSGGGGSDLQSVGHLPQVAVAIEAYHYLRVDVRGAMLRVRALGLGGVEIDRTTVVGRPERVHVRN